MHRNFCKDEDPSSWPSKIDHEQLRAIIEADSLTTTQEFAQELNVYHAIVIWHLKQTGKVKKLGKWMPHELTANKKKRHCFEVSSSLILQNNKPFLNWIVTCKEKWSLYDNQ